MAASPGHFDRDRVFVGLIRIFLNVGEALGHERQELAAAAGIDRGLLRDPDAYVDKARFRALGEALLERDTPVAIGLAAPAATELSSLGLFGYVLRHSATLGDALTQAARYGQVVADPTAWLRCSAGPGRVAVEVRIAAEDEYLAFPVIAQLASWIAFSRMATGVDLPALALSLRGELAGDLDALERHFGCAVETDAEVNRLVVAEESLGLPIRGARPELRPNLELALETLREQDPAGAGLDAQLRALLRERLAGGLTTKAEAARALAVSPRTLSRRLEAAQTSFRELLDEVRRELAEVWLGDPGNSIHEVAFLLGYSDPSSFYRSFRRWTGSTPQRWRAQRAR